MEPTDAKIRDLNLWVAEACGIRIVSVREEVPLGAQPWIRIKPDELTLHAALYGITQPWSPATDFDQAFTHLLGAGGPLEHYGIRMTRDTSGPADTSPIEYKVRKPGPDGKQFGVGYSPASPAYALCVAARAALEKK